MGGICVMAGLPSTIKTVRRLDRILPKIDFSCGMLYPQA
jgi:hypothetical protein